MQFFQSVFTEGILGLAEDDLLGRERPHAGFGWRCCLQGVTRPGLAGQDGDILVQGSRVEPLRGLTR